MTVAQRWAALSLALQFMFGGLFGPYLGPTLLALGYSNSATGLLVASVGLCSIVAPLWVAAYSARRRASSDRVLLACNGLIWACTPLLYLLRAHPLLPLAVVALALARAPLTAVMDDLSMRIAQDDAGIYARLRLCGSGGWMVAASCSGWWLAGAGPERFFWGLGGLAALGWAATWLLPKAAAAPATAPLASDETGLWRQLPARFWFWLGAATLHTFAAAPYNFGFTLYLREQELPAASAGLVWSLGVSAEMIAFAACSRIFRRYSVEQVTALAFVASSLRWLLLAWAPTSAVVVLSQLLHGPGFALFHTAAMQMLARQAARRHQLTLQSLYATLVGGIAVAAGTCCAGWLHEFMPFRQIFACMVPCQLMALVLLYCAGWRPRLSGTRQASPRQAAH